MTDPGEPLLDRRHLLGRLLGTIAAGSTALPLTASASARWDVIVAPGGGVGTVATLAEALVLARPGFRIGLALGTHREKLTVTTPDLVIGATGPGALLAYDAAAGQSRPDGARWGTFGSPTLTIDAPGVTLENLVIRNDFDYLAGHHTGSSNGAQAVALAVGRAADRTIVRDCWIEGYQDTLLVQARARFDRCTISGCVDFLFGGGAAWFDACTIVTRHTPGLEGGGFLAAPSTPAAQRYGFVFDRCRLTREPGVPDHATYLGRPWRAGGDMTLLGAAIFRRCWMDAHIHRDGWTWMHFRDPQGTERRLQPFEARLFEYASRGPGAGPATPSRRLLSAADAAALSRAAVLGTWRG